jgi:hypothetical protein
MAANAAVGPSTCDRRLFERRSQPVGKRISNGRRCVSTGRQRPPKREVIGKREESIAAATASDDEAKAATDWLVGCTSRHFARAITQVEVGRLVAALAGDPHPYRVAQLVVSEPAARPIRLPGAYLLDRIGAARAGEIALRSGGAPLAAGSFTGPKSGPW